MLYNYNSNKLIELLYKSKGENRTFHAFAKESGVDAGYISKIIHNKIDKPPSPEILNKFASASKNSISYKNLMIAAGYLEDTNLETNNINNINLKNNNQLSHFPEQVQSWILDVNNKEFIDFIYIAYKSGVTKQLLKYANILLDFNNRGIK